MKWRQVKNRLSLRERYYCQVAHLVFVIANTSRNRSFVAADALLIKPLLPGKEQAIAISRTFSLLRPSIGLLFCRFFTVRYHVFNAGRHKRRIVFQFAGQ